MRKFIFFSLKYVCIVNGTAISRIINGLFKILLPWKANSKINVSNNAITETGFNLGRNSSLTIAYLLNQQAIYL